MKSPHKNNYTCANCHLPSLLLIIVALVMTGCQSDHKSNEAILDPTTVQGSSFDEPATPQVTPSPTPTPAPQVAVATAAPTPPPDIAPESDTAAPITPATAADVPLDISKIPSMTPPPVIRTPIPNPADALIAAAPQAPIASGDYEPISFKILSGYTYEEPIPNEGDKPEDVEKRRTEDQIPIEVKALDKKKAVVQGWMVPMEINEDGSVKSFVLVKTQPQCCFGDMQAMNEWIDVTMEPGKNAEFNVDLPVKAYGQLEVGEKKEDGFVLSIYRMKAERVEL